MKSTNTLLILIMAQIFIVGFYSKKHIEIFELRRINDMSNLVLSINSNSCFHLELPPSDNHETKRAKGNSKTNTGRNKTNKRKAGAVPKRKP